MDLFSDHNLLFFDFNLFVKLSSSDTRTVLDYRLADWPGLYRTLLSINLSPLIALDQINNMSSNSNPGDINKDWDNLASQGLLLPHGATAKTLVPSGHVNPQILGVIRIAASLPFREEW